MSHVRYVTWVLAVAALASELPDVSESEICHDAELAVTLLQTSLSLDKTPSKENVPSKGSDFQGQHMRPAHRQSEAQSIARLFKQPVEKSPGHSEIALVAACVTILLAVGALACQCTGSDRRKSRTDCGGLCPCFLKEDVPREDLHSWEVSGEDVFGQCFCQSCIPWPRDLSARQWTWRVAEINVWIQVAVATYEVHQSYWAPRAVLKELQVAFATLMLLASLSAVWWVHLRAVDKMLQYVFCSLITKAMYVAAKYAALSGFVAACRLNQMSFAGCNAKGLLAKCLLENSCPQYLLDQTGCQAPGADVCASLDPLKSASGGANLFMNDVIEMLLFLFGIVPVFMAALARESHPDHPEDPVKAQTRHLDAAAVRD